LLQIIVSLIVGYVIGSFPTAYVVMKKTSQVDIRTVGSGNVGAMNAFEASGSSAWAIIILLVDAVKGILSIAVCWLLVGKSFWVLASGGIGSVVGHNYPVWLRFKGGRGLATTAGVMLVLGWIFVAVWCTMWTILYFANKNIHTSNILASIASPIVLFVVPQQYLTLTLPNVTAGEDFLWLSTIVCCLILIRHREFFQPLFRPHTKVP
jgi:glycerol-3-phosphate acyltransferase PlsY